MPAELAEVKRKIITIVSGQRRPMPAGKLFSQLWKEMSGLPELNVLEMAIRQLGYERKLTITERLDIRLA